MHEDLSIMMQTKQNPENTKFAPEICETPVNKHKDVDGTGLATTGILASEMKFFPSFENYLGHPSSYSKNRRLQENLDIAESRVTEEPLVTKASFDAESTQTHLIFEDENNQEVGLRWCPFCQRETIIKRQFKNSARTLWASIAIFFSGGFLGCFLLPYVTKSCKDTIKQCVSCKHNL